MSRYAFIFSLLFASATIALAQQAPGHQPPPPAEHEAKLAAKDKEIERLKMLTEQQNKKIDLLETKVRLLEGELKKKEGAK